MTWRMLCLAFCWLTAPVQAGLILEIDPNIDLSRIESLEVHDGDLVIKTRHNRNVIALPENALPLIAQWATQYAGGPLVYSVELEGVSSLSNIYYSPSSPPGLVDAMFAYDGYHSRFACGLLPEPEERHPLIAQYGDQRAFPPARHAHLLDPENDSPQAIWYRRLARGYAYEPTCYAGQLTISVRHSNTDLPVDLDVRSHRYLVVESWHRRIEILPEADRTAAEMPYELLKRHIETRWEDYRAAFPPFEEVSSIAEALAILYHAYTGHTDLWEGFVETLFARHSYYSPKTVEAARRPMLWIEPTAEFGATVDSSVAWVEIGRQALHEGLHSAAQAELAMAWYVEGRIDDNEPIIRQIEAWVAEHDAQRATWYLAQLVVMPDLDDEFLDLVDGFFELTRDSAFFRDRLDGLRHFEALLSPAWPVLGEFDEGTSGSIPRAKEVSVEVRLRQRIAEHKTLLLSEFQQRVGELCRATEDTGVEPDLTLWENLTRDVYMTQMMDLASSEGELDAEIARLVACVHHRRALAPHVGRDVFYRHAHFRFLGYLAERRPDDHELHEIVHRYRADIAERLGMGAWQEDAWIAYYELPSHQPFDDQGAVVFDDPLDQIQGALVPVHRLVAPEVGDCAGQAINCGCPLAVVSPEGDITILLLDSLLLAPRCTCSSAYPEARPLVRVRGLILDQGRSLVPYQMEVRCAATWQAIYLPRSGMTGK